jgi:hypothetical protein
MAVWLWVVGGTVLRSVAVESRDGGVSTGARRSEVHTTVVSLDLCLANRTVGVRSPDRSDGRWTYCLSLYRS